MESVGQKIRDNLHALMTQRGAAPVCFANLDAMVQATLAAIETTPAEETEIQTAARLRDALDAAAHIYPEAIAATNACSKWLHEASHKKTPLRLSTEKVLSWGQRAPAAPGAFIVVDSFGSTWSEPILRDQDGTFRIDEKLYLESSARGIYRGDDRVSYVAVEPQPFIQKP